MKEPTLPPAPGWLVQLIGHVFDCSYWERSLKPPFDPWCKRIPQGENSAFVLSSRIFADAKTADEVRARAIPLIERLNGALSVMAGVEPLRLAGVGQIDERGAFHVTRFIEADLRARSAMMAAIAKVDPEGKLVPFATPGASAAQRWAEAAGESDDLSDLLVFAGRADNWFDIYKAIEVAERLCGGEHDLARLLGTSWPECKNLRSTANYYRHARGKTYRPDTLTTLTEAKPLLSFIVRTVLNRRVN